MKRILFLSVIALSTVAINCNTLVAQRGPGRGQQQQPAQTRSVSNEKARVSDEWMDNITWRSIGPANMSGRISSIAVYEKDPCIWWAASASGGLIKTENNGISFEHQFDDQATVSIGDVQVAQSDPNTVWVGTGEANPRNSVSWGDGVYKSTDGGKTWKNMGLNKSFQIGRIAIHPEDPNIVYVGALGRLWGPNEERGLFKTTDGGETWDKILYVDDKTGVVDIQMHPQDPNTLMVATYERQRDGFDGNSPEKKYGGGSAIYRTTNGGESFDKVSEGLPSCKMGRIGLNYYRKDPNLVYAIVESEKIAKEPETVGYAGVEAENADVGAKLTGITDGGPAEKAGLKKDDIVLSVNDKLIHSYPQLQAEFRRHKKGDKLKIVVSRELKSVEMDLTLAERPAPRRRRTGNGNRNRTPRTPFTGTLGGQAANLQGQQGDDEHEYGGVYMSKDGGKSWNRINTLNPRPMYYSQFRVDPSDNQFMYVLGTSLYRSTDGGETFTGDGGRGIHPDNHAMWIDPNDGRHMILGNDGGIHVTFDRMDNWDHLAHVAIGQFYHVGIDHNRNYKVYGGLQDNGSWGGPNMTRTGGPTNDDWQRVGGGDGFITLVDPTDANQIYFESQNGSMGRIHLETGERGFIRARAPRGTRYRYNWKTPFILSPHNPKIHYSAGNYVFRSVSKGDNVKAISPDITNTDRGAGSAISESAVEEGVIYVGTTDGAVWMTRDGGEEWEEIFVQREEKAEGEEESEAEGNARSSGERPRARGNRRGGRGGDRPQRRRRPAADQSDQEKSASDKPAAEEKPKAEEKSDKKADEKKADEKKADEKKAEPAADDHPMVGSWKGELLFDRLPEGQRAIEMNLMVNDAGKIEGTFKTPRSTSQISNVKFNKETGEFTFDGKSDVRDVSFSGKLVDGNRIEGVINMGQFQIDFVIEKDDLVSATMYVSTSRGMVQDDDPITGKWACEIFSENIPEGQGKFSMELKLEKDGVFTGMASSPMGDLEVAEGEFNSETKKLKFVLFSEESGMEVEATATLKGSQLEGSLNAGGGSFEADFSATRESTEVAADEPAADEPAADEPAAKPAQETRRQRRSRGNRAAAASAAQTQESEEAREAAASAAADDPVTGKWEGRYIAEFFQGDRAKFTMILQRDAKGNVTGVLESMQNETEIEDGKFNADDKTISLTVDNGRFTLEFSGAISDDAMDGEVNFGGQRSFDFEAKRVSTTASLDPASDDEPETTGDRLGDLVPGPRWVSSIDASKFQKGRVYLSLDGHRSNDDEPYVFVSENYGKTWSSIRANLPAAAGSVRVIREDIKNESLLFLGCEFSAWVSIDRGKSWTRFKGGLPTVAVHEFAIHPTSGEVVAGTHGRSLWIADVTPLRQLSSDAMKMPAVLLKPNEVVQWRRGQERGTSGTRRFVGQNPSQSAKIFYHIGQRAREVALRVYDVKGNIVRTLDAENGNGLHMVEWDLRRTTPNQGGRAGGGRPGGGRPGGGRFRRGPTLPNGTYIVALTVDGQVHKELLSIKNDPEFLPSVTTDEEWEFMKMINGIESEDQHSDEIDRN